MKLKKGFITPSKYTEWVDSIGLDKTWLGHMFSRLDYRFRLKRLALVFLFSLALSFMLLSSWQLGYRMEVGDVVKTNIISPVSFDFIDETVTDEKRHNAEMDVAPVYDLDFDIYEKKAEGVTRAFRMLRGQTQKLDVAGEKLFIAVHELAPWRSRFEKEIGVGVPDRVWEWLVRDKFSVKVESLIVRVLDNWSQLKIADGLHGKLENGHEQIFIRSHEIGKSSGEEFLVGASEIKDINKRSGIEAEAAQILSKLDRSSQKLALRFVGLLLVPNLKFNDHETATRRKLARDRVNPVWVSVKKNQVVVKEGSTISQAQKTILTELERMQFERRNKSLALACALLLMTVIMVFFSYIRRFTLNKVRVEAKDILCMGVVTLVVVGLCKFTLALGESELIARFGHSLPETSMMYLMPVAAGPMMVGLLVASGEILWLFTIFLASSIGVMVDMNFAFILVGIVGGIAGARGVFNCKKRNDIYWAGLRAGFVNAFVIVLISALTTPSHEEFIRHALAGAIAGLASGILSSLITMIIIPLLENLFNYTTDVKLFELSNLNHPLLKELIVKAPGTYHHSLVVGSMVEAAAEEIGANPLLAKVMAYYHDVGKMEHAQYFIENQRPGLNPHDTLSAHMSKHILIAHVKDGIEMGLKYKLGQQIIDGMVQHHGTTLISYFYNKAVENQKEDIESVSEEDFRYPGPKPQFREAALCMLADSIEAAARALDEPTPSRLQNIVKNIVQRKFLDGQLDECNLTLRDLSDIENSFARVLLGVYHARIDYPKSAGGGASETPSNVRSLPNKQSS